MGEGEGGGVCFPLPFIPSRQPFDVLTVPRKIEGGRGKQFSDRLHSSLL
jgi:hypothetical protein